MDARSNSSRLMLAIFGVITAMVIVFSHLFYFQAAHYYRHTSKTQKTEKHQKQEHHKAADGQNVYLSTPSSPAPPSVHQEVSHESAFIFEITYEKENETPSFSAPKALGNLFQTLFRAIISPNAP